MRTTDRAVTICLFAAAVVSIVVGIATIVLGQTMTRNRVEQSSELLRDNLETARRVAESLQDHRGQLQAIARLPTKAARAARQAPAALSESADLMRAGVQTMRRTAGSMRQLEAGVDFLTPGSSLSKNADAVANLADKMAEMRQVVLDARDPVHATVQQLQAALEAQRTLRRALEEAGVGPDLLVRRLERTRQLQRRANLPAAAAWQQTAAGLAFVLVGILLGGVAMIWRRSLPDDES